MDSGEEFGEIGEGSLSRKNEAKIPKGIVAVRSLKASEIV
jgi:hypothetical protein